MLAVKTDAELKAALCKLRDWPPSGCTLQDGS